MKRLLILLLIPVVLAAPAAAASYSLGVGLHGGFDMPVLQSDVGSGSMYALSVRGNIWRFLHGQILFRGTSLGATEEELGTTPPEVLTYEGGSLTGFGLNLLFARRTPANFWPYGIIGFSSNSLNFGDEFKEDQSFTGWTYGGGAGINLYQRKIYLDINTSLLVMPFHDNKASRKNWQTMLGVQYYIPINTK